MRDHFAIVALLAAIAYLWGQLSWTVHSYSKYRVQVIEPRGRLLLLTPPFDRPQLLEAYDRQARSLRCEMFSTNPLHWCKHWNDSYVPYPVILRDVQKEIADTRTIAEAGLSAGVDVNNQEHHA